MNRYRGLISGLLVLVGALAVLAFLASRRGGPDAAAARAASEPRAEPVKAALPKSARSAAADAARVAARSARVGKSEARSGAGTSRAAVGARGASTPTREQALAAWESLVDQVIEQKDVPADAQAKRVKEAFDRLNEEDQMDGIRRVLNLLPDERFPVLYAILYDKTENAEVLDAIFSDALNRPDEIKNPLMKELRQDREHPLFFESARILDVVEPAADRAPP